MPQATTALSGLRALLLIGAGAVLTIAMCMAVTDDGATAFVFAVILLSGPAWAVTFALVSDDDDFAGAGRTRGEWLRVLPWTFVLAPLVLPNLVLLTAFLRDSRADGGRSWLTWDRMRPGEGAHEDR